MLSKKIIIKNGDNFNVSIATKIVDKLAEFDSNCKITHQNHTIDPKSIISLLSMDLTDNDYIDVEIVGDDAQFMLESIESILEKAGII